MSPNSNRFEQLAAQVRAGHVHVRAQMQRELEPSMLRAINCALTPGVPASPLNRLIAAVSRQMHVGPSAGPEERRRLARALCQRMVNRIGPFDTQAPDGIHTLVA